MENGCDNADLGELGVPKPQKHRSKPHFIRGLVLLACVSSGLGVSLESMATPYRYRLPERRSAKQQPTRDSQTNAQLKRKTASESRGQVPYRVPSYYDGRYAAALPFEIRRQRPLQNRRLLLVNHLYGDIHYFLDLFEVAGLAPANTEIIGTLYPFDSAVKQSVRKRGYALSHEGHLHDPQAFKKSIREAIGRLAAGQIKDPVLIVDDGGTAAEIIAAHFPHVKTSKGEPAFHIIEITRNGHRPIEKLKASGRELPFKFSSGALSDAKRDLYSPEYALTALEKGFSAMRQAGLETSNNLGAGRPVRRVGIIGAGAMGMPVALALARQNYRVTVYERDPKQLGILRWAASQSHARLEYAISKEEALWGQDIIVSATGLENIIGPKDLPFIRHGAALFQISSKRRDFDMDGFAQTAHRTKLLTRTDGLAQQSKTYVFRDVPIVTANSAEALRFVHAVDRNPTLHNETGEKQVHFIGDGWTINHNGSAEGSCPSVVTRELDMVAKQIFAAAAGKRAVSIGEVSELDAGSWLYENALYKDRSLSPGSMGRQIDALEQRKKTWEP